MVFNGKRMGMSNVRKTSRTNKPKKVEEKIPQPTITPRQRLIQQLWMQDTVPRVPPKVRLPQGGENALVPAAKRPRTTTEPGYRSEPVVVSVEETDILQKVRDLVSGDLVELLSPMSSNHSEMGVEDGVQKEGRGKMAEPTPTEHAPCRFLRHSLVPSAREPASENVPVTIIADVHVPSETVHEQPGNSRREETPSGDVPDVRRKVTILSDVRVPIRTVREQPGVSRLEDEVTAVGDSDDDETHAPRNSSQDEWDRKVVEMTQLKIRCCDEIEASERNVALLQKEDAELKAQMEIIQKRRRAIFGQRHEEERRKVKWSGRLAALKTIFE